MANWSSVAMRAAASKMFLSTRRPRVAALFRKPLQREVVLLPDLIEKAVAQQRNIPLRFFRSLRSSVLIVTVLYRYYTDLVNPLKRGD